MTTKLPTNDSRASFDTRPHMDHAQRSQLLLSRHGRALDLVAKLLAAGVEPAKLHPYNLPKLTVKVNEAKQGSDLVFYSEGERVKVCTINEAGAELCCPHVWDFLRAEEHIDIRTHRDNALVDAFRHMETSRDMLASLGAMLVYPAAAGFSGTRYKPDLEELVVPGDWVIVTPEMRAVLEAYFVHVAKHGLPGIWRPPYLHPIKPDGDIIYIGDRNIPVDHDWLASLDQPTRKRFMKLNCGCSAGDVDAFEAKLAKPAEEA